MWWIVLVLLWVAYSRQRRRAYHHPENATYVMIFKAWRLGGRAALVAWFVLLWPGCVTRFPLFSETLPLSRSAQRLDEFSLSSPVPSWSEKTTDGSKP